MGDFLGKAVIVKSRSATRENDAAAGAKRTKPNSDASSFEVFVGGLYSIGRKVIKRHFSECGEIKSFEMPLTAAGESKGIAFIAYTSESGLQKALELHETRLGKRWLTVEKRVEKDMRKK